MNKKIEKKSYLDWILNTPVKSPLLGLANYRTNRPMIVPRLYCMDGESVSIQAGEYMYCLPRENYSGWFEVEAGYPSCVPPIEWKKYADQWEMEFREKIKDFLCGIKFSIDTDIEHGIGTNLQRFLCGFLRGFKREFIILVRKHPCNIIYPYLPVELVKQFITEHGGEDTKKCFSMLKKQMKRNGVR